MKLKELKKARLTTDELQSALRLKTIGNVEDVELALLESNVRFQRFKAKQSTCYKRRYTENLRSFG